MERTQEQNTCTLFEEYKHDQLLNSKGDLKPSVIILSSDTKQLLGHHCHHLLSK